MSFFSNLFIFWQGDFSASHCLQVLTWKHILEKESKPIYGRYFLLELKVNYIVYAMLLSKLRTPRNQQVFWLDQSPKLHPNPPIKSFIYLA